MVLGLSLVAYVRIVHKRHARQYPVESRAGLDSDQVTPLEEALFRREYFRETSGTVRLNKARLPCCLLVGPFGAGKTTVLRSLLQGLSSQTNLKVGAIVNDFSDLGIDFETIRNENEFTVAASQGCCCCSTLDNKMETGFPSLPQQLDLQRRYGVDCVIVEANGLSEASGSRARLLAETRLDSVVGVVDATSFPPSGWNTEAHVHEFAKSCEVILVNKSDLAEETQVQSVVDMLKSAGAVDVRASQNGRIPIDLAFKLKKHAAQKGELGLCVAEKKMAERFELDQSDSCEVAVPVVAGLDSRHASTLQQMRWKSFYQSDSPVVSLACLQDAVCKWEALGTLQRAKGKVWIGNDGLRDKVLEFHYSGRCRTFCSKLNRPSTLDTKLALVSEADQDFGVAEHVLLAKTRQASSEDEFAYRAVRDVLAGDSRVTLYPDQGAGSNILTFSVTCYSKYGVSSKDLSERFGVSIPDVNHDFQLRLNSSGSCVIVAFDGQLLYLAPTRLLDLTQTLSAIDVELDHTVNTKFSVVRRACKCDI